MLQKDIIPPQVGFSQAMENLSPHVRKCLQDARGGIVIPTEPSEWKGAAGKPRRILVNNFDAAVSLDFSENKN
jgi:hypothetical protein